jgi:hypothetical protein
MYVCFVSSLLKVSPSWLVCDNVASDQCSLLPMQCGRRWCSVIGGFHLLGLASFQLCGNFQANSGNMMQNKMNNVLKN